MSLEDCVKLLNTLIETRYSIPVSLYHKVINLVCDKCMSNIIGRYFLILICYTSALLIHQLRHTTTAINESIDLMQSSIAILELMDERTIGTAPTHLSTCLFIHVHLTQSIHPGAKSAAYDKVLSLTQYCKDISSGRTVYSVLRRRGNNNYFLALGIFNLTC